MAYRTIEIVWQPRSSKQWRTFTLARQEAARLWNDLVARHARLRHLHWTWPTQGRWEKWAQRRYPHLSAQSAQQVIGEFVEAVISTRQKRKQGDTSAAYPWKTRHYRDIPYTNQDATIKDHKLRLPHGQAGRLRIRLPGVLPGRLVEARLCYGKVILTCEQPDAPRAAQTSTGNDLGVNTLIAATDGHKATLVSGREAKATVQWRNKRLASLQQAQAAKVKGSCRWKRLQLRKYQLLAKAQRRLRDLAHKATAMVQRDFPDAHAYVGEPFNGAAPKAGRHQAQQVSSACNRKLIDQLTYKAACATVVPEPYSSQTCPVCGRRQMCRRTYRCRRCGYTAPRDVVGAINILRIGQTGAMYNSPAVPSQITYRRPVRGGRRQPCPKWRLRSSGGHPACSSA